MADTTTPTNEDELVDYDEENEQEEKVGKGLMGQDDEDGGEPARPEAPALLLNDPIKKR